jgi:hypothetical protein
VDCYALGSIGTDFEGAWAQKWAQRNSCVGIALFARKNLPGTSGVITLAQLV